MANTSNKRKRAIRKKAVKKAKKQCKPLTVSSNGTLRVATKRERPKFMNAVRYDTGSILLLGDGDFSFAEGLIAHRNGSGRGVIATSFDSRTAVERKYGESSVSARLSRLTAAGAVVKHDVDARALDAAAPVLLSTLRDREKGGNRLDDSSASALSQQRFSRVVFNFPHSGQQRVHVNRALLQSFFATVPAVLSSAGEVHITIKMKPPYSLWGIEDIAKDNKFRLVATKEFDQQLFPGYRHQTTEADAVTFRAAGNIEARSIKTLCFAKKK
mmetsp:Transcript_9498/g.14297  ORF Transcript_9498/g.14297 Transcript_9498/m.14297 type:complete len:271 (-) Transcript_9498:133-945(-)|eukprot:CAMPEP_0185031294 /NCGR_PEP_ID=MMETSP1103-20130426/18689_1 /TAXON_ID=36769 /ORGANISM="Paraphysomonas bandaiensis, Strain Caron Lab Isolate" /LENGTH=270 /DNA_ID=CAMNT_0027566777 /DNA_START=17 /DNA_END=829 /DNA_ORIENTATION=-